MEFLLYEILAEIQKSYLLANVLMFLEELPFTQKVGVPNDKMTLPLLKESLANSPYSFPELRDQ